MGLHARSTSRERAPLRVAALSAVGASLCSALACGETTTDPRAAADASVDSSSGGVGSGGVGGSSAGSGGSSGTSGGTGGTGGTFNPCDTDAAPPGQFASCCQGSPCFGYCISGKCDCFGVSGGCSPPAVCCAGVSSCTAGSTCAGSGGGGSCAPDDGVGAIASCCGGAKCHGWCNLEQGAACECFGLVGGCGEGTVCCKQKKGCTSPAGCTIGR